MKAVWGERVTTVFVRQGHYGLDPAIVKRYPAADLTIERIGDLSSAVRDIRSAERWCGPCRAEHPLRLRDGSRRIAALTGEREAGESEHDLGRLPALSGQRGCSALQHPPLTLEGSDRMPRASAQELGQ